MAQAETDEARTAEVAKLEAGMRVMDQFLEKHGHPEGPFLLGKGDGAYCVGALIVAMVPVPPVESIPRRTHLTFPSTQKPTRQARSASPRSSSASSSSSPTSPRSTPLPWRPDWGARA